MRWDDDDGEQNLILDEATLDEAIQYYHSTNGILVTISIKISLEYDEHSHLGASPLVRREADLAEGYQDTFSRAEFSSPLHPEGGDAMTTSPKDAGESTLNTVPRKPPRSHIHNPGSCATSSIDGGATRRGVIDGSTDARSSCGTSFSQQMFKVGRRWSWVEIQARDPILDALAQEDVQSLSSISLSSGPSVSDGVSDTGISSENRARRDNYSSSRSSGPARDLEYEALVNDRSHSNNDIGIADDLDQEFTCCSECECILDSIKYICTTCGGKTPTSRAALIAAAEAKGKGGRNREASSSPTRTILGRSHSSSVSSTLTARTGYELCTACFERVGVDHSWASCVSGYFSTEKELGIARRSQPKQKGLLRHAFVEKFWDLHCWTDIENMPHQSRCSICETGLSEDRYKCGICDDFTLCRGCFSIVHNVHPTHPFLDIKIKAATETLDHSEISHYEISEGITAADDNADESPLKHVGYQCSYCELDIFGARFECQECEDINLCSKCDNTGLLPDGGHSSAHIMSKIPEPKAHGQHRGQDPANLSPNPGTSVLSINAAGTDVEENYIHSQICDSCEETIVGVRYQCLNCPSKPSSYDLCTDCEVNSYIVHDPMHTFLKIPRPVDIPGPLESEFPFIPVLYQYPAGPAPGSPSNRSSDSDPTVYLRYLTHAFALCDRHMGKIVGKWYRCAYCSMDLCADCEAIDTHDKTHAFLVFKAPVDKHAFRPFENAGKSGSPPLLHGNIYCPQHNQ
ncbi:hypothetical protein V8E53_012297 [Lactarius tabidus]